MQLQLCVCDVFPRFELKTQVIAMIHSREYWRPSNTGHLVRLCLENSQVVKKLGDQGYKESPLRVDDSWTNYALFPAPDAKVLSPEMKSDAERAGKPIRLYVPDGSWRQASKMVTRDSVLASLPKVVVPESDRASVYRLRTESRSEGMATFEAIARAIGALEGDAVGLALETAFRKFSDRVLWTRGFQPFSEIQASLPASVLR